jgi:hypothetical protein
MAGVEGLLAEISAEFPGFRLIKKSDSRLMTLIHWALQLLTLGGQSRFLAEYHTVIGYTLYVAPSWEQMVDVERIALLSHERVHMRQRRKYGLLGMTFLYLIPFFPIGLAYARARLEWEAYSETLRVLLQMRGEEVLRDEALRQRIVGRFVGPDYAWMWPFRGCVEKWYDDLLLQLNNDLSDNRRVRVGRVADSSGSGPKPIVGKEPEGTWEQS